MELLKKWRGHSLHPPLACLFPGRLPRPGDPRQKEAVQSSEPSKPGHGSSPRGKGEGLLLLIS